MRKATTATGSLALILALTLAGCSSTDTDSKTAPAASASAASDEASVSSPPATDAADDMTTDGAWIDLAAYEADPAMYHAAGDVVLFFSATWCPTCQATVKSLDTDGTPAGLTVVRVDYDDNAQLKKQYGVTVQHTFVQVDEDGNEVTSFTGSRTGEEIAAKTA